MSAQMERSALAGLPQYPECTHYLYAAEFHTGIVKIGRTSTPKVRLSLLWDEGRRKGLRMTRLTIAEVDRKVGFWEARFIERCARIARRSKGKREWFETLRFGDAVTAMSQVQRRCVLTEKVAA